MDDFFLFVFRVAILCVHIKNTVSLSLSLSLSLFYLEIFVEISSLRMSRKVLAILITHKLYIYVFGDTAAAENKMADLRHFQIW